MTLACSSVVKHLSKHTIQSITLIAGVATALLLIFGTFFQSTETVVLPSLLGWITEPVALERIQVISSALVDIIQGFRL